MSKRMMSGLFLMGSGVVGFLAVSLWLGPGQAHVGTAIFLGAVVGVSSGNLKAREADEYRSQWLQMRQAKPSC